MYDVIALGELLVDFAPVSTDGEGYPAHYGKTRAPPGFGVRVGVPTPAGRAGGKNTTR